VPTKYIYTFFVNVKDPCILCASLGSHNKQLIFLCTGLSSWSVLFVYIVYVRKYYDDEYSICEEVL
jgi:hypothetical protein